MNEQSLGHMFFDRAKLHAAGAAFRVKKNGAYVDVGYREAAERVNAIAAGLMTVPGGLARRAGVGILGPIATASFSDWDLGLDVNIGGVVNGITTFLPRMIAQGTGGHIVNTASLSAISPSPRDSTIYATTKAAIMAMSEAMQEELADHGIGVSVLLPGPFKTNIREVGRNRAARYQSESGYRAVEERLAAREDASDWLDPLEAGYMVRDAILQNRLYVITHGEFKGWAESKFEDILAAYPPPRDPERAKAMGRRRPIRKT